MLIDFGLNANYQVVSTTHEFLSSQHITPHYYSMQDGPLPEIQYASHYLITYQNTLTWALGLYGNLDNPQVEGVHACPSAKHFLAIVGSTAFYIDSSIPGNVVAIGEFVRRVEKYLFLDLILVLDYYSMVAIGKDGVLWRTKRLVQDAIHILKIDNDSIIGEGDFQSAKSGEADIFEVSTKDGSVLQGNLFTE